MLSPTRLRNSLRGWQLIGLGILFDAVDFLGIPALPIIGDVLDIMFTFTIGYLSKSKLAFLDLLELIPGEDPFPTYTVVSILIALYDMK